MLSFKELFEQFRVTLPETNIPMPKHTKKHNHTKLVLRRMKFRGKLAFAYPNRKRRQFLRQVHLKLNGPSNHSEWTIQSMDHPITQK